MMTYPEENTLDTLPPFFIVGCDRSGTTLLRLMLNANSNIDIPNESDFLAYIIDKRDEYHNLEDDMNVETLFEDMIEVERLMNWGITESCLKDKILSSDRSLRSIVSIPFEIHMNEKGKKRWGDKTPRYTRYIQGIHDIFPDALFINLVRDGRSVAASLKKVSWFSDDILDIAYHWNIMVRSADSSQKYLGNQYMELKYEDLVSNPPRILKQVCEYLGVEYEESMLEYWKASHETFNEMHRGDHHLLDKNPDASRIDAWRSQLSDREILLFEFYAGKTLEKFGYQKSMRPSKLRILFLYIEVSFHKIVRAIRWSRQHIPTRNK